jgi:hypothetical protein
MIDFENSQEIDNKINKINKEYGKTGLWFKNCFNDDASD